MSQNIYNNINIINNTTSNTSETEVVKQNMFETKAARGRCRLVLKPLSRFSVKEFQQCARNTIKEHVDELLKENDDENLKKKVIELVRHEVYKREGRPRFPELQQQFTQFGYEIARYAPLRKKLSDFSKKTEIQQRIIDRQQHNADWKLPPVNEIGLREGWLLQREKDHTPTITTASSTFREPFYRPLLPAPPSSPQQHGGNKRGVDTSMASTPKNNAAMQPKSSLSSLLN